jgi:serine/threonine protein kinase
LEARFKIIKKLGSGAFGEIFKGTWQSFALPSFFGYRFMVSFSFVNGEGRLIKFKYTIVL